LQVQLGRVNRQLKVTTIAWVGFSRRKYREQGRTVETHHGEETSVGAEKSVSAPFCGAFLARQAPHFQIYAVSTKTFRKFCAILPIAIILKVCYIIITERESVADTFQRENWLC